MANLERRRKILSNKINKTIAFKALCVNDRLLGFFIHNRSGEDEVHIMMDENDIGEDPEMIPDGFLENSERTPKRLQEDSRLESQVEPKRPPSGPIGALRDEQVLRKNSFTRLHTGNCLN